MKLDVVVVLLAVIAALVVLALFGVLSAGA